MNKVLLVEDDNQIREAIVDYFSEKGKNDIELHTACNVEQAEKQIFENEFDLMLFDVMLPDGDGFELCRSVRTKSMVPIIFLTAKSREEDVLYGYATGCDDYMIKPFSLAELIAKIRAVIRRSKGESVGKKIVCGDVELNPYTYTVAVSGEKIELAPKEYLLLKYLMERKENVIERETLLTAIWGYDFEGNERVVDNHIKKIRKKLGRASKQIKTVISRGYKITD